MVNLSLRAVTRLGHLRHLLAIIVYLTLAVTTGCNIQGVVGGSVTFDHRSPFGGTFAFRGDVGA